MDDGPLPKLIAFDLDYTLWNFWIDTHIEVPLRQDKDTGVVYDSSSYNQKTVEFYKDVPEILRSLKDKVSIAAASRSSAGKLAREALGLIRIPTSSVDTEDTTNILDGVDSLPAIKFFDHLEIYPGSKIAHFKQIHKNTAIPYSEMLFFDDETRNREVDTKLGVTFVLVEDGMNWQSFEKGLREWRKRRLAVPQASQ
ncbi:magnesium-dependent phosphatase-1 [Gyrodon lividus]|nr:magnesium-dependent phosphatase-1 [Gyrodon lividus]